MDHKLAAIQVERTLLKELTDNRNKAELMRIMAEGAHGEVRRLYCQVAAAFSDTASKVEELKRALASQKSRCDTVLRN